MAKLIAIVGASGAGKTTLAQTLARQGGFRLALEAHVDRPFQERFKRDPTFAFANQVDYLLFRAQQERELRFAETPGVIDGGLDLDFHGFTRLFNERGWLTDSEFDLCRRLYEWTRQLLPLPDLIVALNASPLVISERLTKRPRINIASGADAKVIQGFIDEWLTTLPDDRILSLDTSFEGITYSSAAAAIMNRFNSL